ncbi:MAG: hypothetical protein K6D96_08305 [Acetatifactor sp.]|nr:hypothetical protein [Acetatifactor sp.]
MDKKKMDKRIEAYLSLEAAYVIPIVLAVIIFLIYMMIYKYDACVTSNKALLLSMSQETDCAQTVFMEEDNDISTETPLYIEATVSGRLHFPFSDMEVLKAVDDMWNVEAKGRFYKTDPVFIIRNARKLKELTEEKDGN